jgi:pimeloyl-ACP methyl ester carboxylesterase
MIHGHGSTGDQLFTRPDIRDNWLPLFRAQHGILTLNLRGNAWMSPAAAADVHALLAEVQARYGHHRFIFASGSMGGTSNLIYAALHPEDVAGVVALCPATDLPSYHAWAHERAANPILKEISETIATDYAGSPDQRADVYRAHSALTNRARLTMPVFVGHGSADSIIPVEQSRALAEAMTANPNFRYVELEGGEHDAPLAQMKEALAWVLDRLGHPKD